MREPEEMGYYAVMGDDGEPCTVHGIKSQMPEGSVEITPEQAKEISAVRRERYAAKLAGQLPQPGAQFHVDLQPILDQLDKQSKVLADHAAVLDEHAATAAEHAEKFDQQAQAILDVKAKTAKAIAEALNGLGEKGS